MKLGLGLGLVLKRLLFVSSLFVHENHSQGSFLTRRVPWGQKRVKNNDFKILSFLAKSLIPPIRKNSIFGLPTNIHSKAAKRISVGVSVKTFIVC